MGKYEVSTGKKRRWPKIIIVLAVVSLVVTILTVLVIRRAYEENLRPVSASQRSVQVSIPIGSSVKEIGQRLEEAGVIRAAWAFEWYVRNNDLNDELLAGTYSFRPNQGVKEIINILTQGKIATDLMTNCSVCHR